MATTITKAVLTDTYKDDFLDSDAYHKILFNSGRSLQARELTQIQTILQNQIKKFGDHYFREGAPVKPGGLHVNLNYEFIKLNTASNALPADITTLVGTSFTGQTSGVIAKVLEVTAASGGDPATLFVIYTSTVASGASTADAIRMNAGEDVNNGTVTLTVQTTNTTANPAIGVGTRVSIGEGTYYANGHFVFCTNQSKIISKYTDNPTTDIGYKIVEEVVTTSDDQDLYDNQGSTPNISAPGADRYRIRLVLAEKSEIASSENFVHVASISNGEIVAQIDDSSEFNAPRKLVAQRIKENSGDYIVKPFKIAFEDDSAATHIVLRVSDGVVVVDGYRAARQAPTKIRLAKSSSTQTANNDVVASDFGNYVDVDPTVAGKVTKVANALGDSSLTNAKGLPNIESFEKLDLMDSVCYRGDALGSARVRAITENGANLKYHLFDIQMNAGQAFRNVKSIGVDSNTYFNPILELSKAVLKEPSNNNLLFKLKNVRPSSLTDISLASQRRFTATSNGGGEATISLSASGETFTNTGDWVISKTDSDVISDQIAAAAIGGAGATSSTMTGLPASASLEILAYVNKANGSIRSKTLTSGSIITGMDSAGTAIDLRKADIYDVQSIVNAADSNEDYSNRFSLDNGQRDNYYGRGKLDLLSGNAAPSGNVYVSFRYFTHGAAGDFFAINSYTGQVDYNNIPRHTLTDGTVKQLYNYLDFRSVKDSDDNFSSTVLGARIHELPQPGTLVQADVSYYQSSAQTLGIDTTGELQLIQGTSGNTPLMPEIPEGVLPLYEIILGPNTLTSRDVAVLPLDKKRYTMADIAALDQRLDKLEEFTALSLLETGTKNFEVLDSAGLNRTKAGLVVDNFADHYQSDVKNLNYAAAIDIFNKELRPAYAEDNIKLMYDSASSTNTIKKGDNIYIKFNEEVFIDQSLASKSVVINPFEVVIRDGIITLSPSSDEWRDVQKEGKKIVENEFRFNGSDATNWNSWNWNWGGVSTSKLTQGSTSEKRDFSGNVTSSTTKYIQMKINKINSVDTKLRDRLVSETFYNYIRSRPIFFKAEGLRPNSKHFAYFDGVSVAAWVKEESFVRHADNSEDYGDKWRGLTGHPKTAGTLESDANGIIEGSFWIPNTNTISFLTGSSIEFKLLDVSVDDESNATSRARALYSASGVLATYSPEYKTTRTAHITQIKEKPKKKDPVILPYGTTGYSNTNNTPSGQEYIPNTTSSFIHLGIDPAAYTTPAEKKDPNNGGKTTSGGFYDFAGNSGAQ